MGEERKIDVADLRPGMYVSRLDRAWLESPFPFQGLLLENWEQVVEVRNLCRHVYVETRDAVAGARAKGHRPGGASAEPRGPRRIRRSASDRPPRRDDEATRSLSWQDRLVQQWGLALEPPPPVTASLKDEIRITHPLIRDTRALVQQQIDDARNGRSLDVPAARECVAQLTDSILRNPHALVWLSALKDRDEYTYLHSLSVCILSLSFGRHLGLPHDALLELGFGAFLHDIGKLHIPDNVLNKPGQLTPQEMAIMRRHPQLGVEIVDGSERIPKSSRDVIYSHHERRDGSGYTEGVTGERIHPLTQIVSLCDTYDAIISHRPYKTASSPLSATGVLYRARGGLFEADLVHKFISCIGIYPAGSLVELSTGEVGVVLANGEDRLRPKVFAVLDEEHQRLKRPYDIDLMHMLQADDGRYLEVQRSLEVGAYGLQPADMLGYVEQA